MKRTQLPVQAGDHVAILLCTYSPGNYFFEQLDSVIAQSHQNFSLWVSDESQDDSAVQALNDYVSRVESFSYKLVRGPCKGFATNFLSLLCQPGLQADYYAFCDQDDVWNSDKLEVAIRALKCIDPGVPAVYCGRTLLTDAKGKEIGYSADRQKPPSFSNALVQSLAGGNTMVLNHSARELVKKPGQPTIVSHDWWVYVLVSGAGGRVIFDTTPTIRYRQHDTNLVGANTSLAANLFRIKMLFGNRFRGWNETNVNALMSAQHLLTPGNRERFRHFTKARSGNVLSRFYHLLKSGAHRQTFMGNLGLVIATLTGKI